ncbi:glycoside hydrolase domain-containing protein [Agriterribacter sp.]|uniref:DUF4091 domain-containing protein n=1 Tax=Agriterribacter sp. TaxID=2821509 RepID=UPI002B57149E|nr:glycoside hydrolase domain-containing protein [Agriterribacter sp.]HRO46663.1 DUF6067 family protein [Agriterribacter sp.]HRQ17324.1 DUF6067 family protein [Agriterribacter sp.]
MKKWLMILPAAFCTFLLFGQDKSYSTEDNRYFTEAAIRLSPPDESWQTLQQPVMVSFANSNTRYAKEKVPFTAVQQSWNAAAWKGEKVHTQLLVWTNEPVTQLTYTLSNLVNAKKQTIPAPNIKAGFIRYVITDEFAGGCGYRKPADFDSSLAADAIDIISSMPVDARTVQPIWLSIHVPQNARPGNYKGSITVKADKSYTLYYTVKVIDRVLPTPDKWTFDLDLWQHPAAIARVHDVPLWSDKHFDLMKPYYTLLAGAGQKNITASIMDEPWGHQTYDDFPGLIKWTKHKDGSWVYDYSLFDKYVAFVMSCGINKRINCYTMVPWALSFRYFDEAAGKDTMLKAPIGSVEYTAHWTSMLKDFTQHLKHKGWFDITTIAMDERPMKDMQVVIALLKSIDPGWKIALAGNYHPEIEKDIYDYCLASNLQFDEAVLKERIAEGKPSTYYTCCTENYPNGFTFSPPAEHVWLGWYAAAKGFTGYLRWAYNSWVADPLRDSRFRSWPAGDTYQVYPGPRTSVRFEKLIEGIQDFEKIKLLQKEFTVKGNTRSLQKLDNVLQPFAIEKLKTIPAEDMVRQAKKILNE